MNDGDAKGWNALPCLTDAPWPAAEARVSIPDPKNPGFRIVGYRVPTEHCGPHGIEAVFDLQARDREFAALRIHHGRLTPDALESALRQIGAERYHHLHPFHRALHEGRLTLGQVQAWALNRYYYQSQIPVKDATLLARLPTPELRREWRSRLVDHDGDESGTGGIERWLMLTDGLGLDRDYVVSLEGLLPATRFAVNAYIEFVQTRSVLEAIASSLTEMFSSHLISERVAAMLRHYDFVSSKTLAYFAPRLSQAPADCRFALAYVLEHARTAEQQAAVLDAMRFKCSVLWAMLDALDYSYVTPGFVPPGSFGAK